MEVHMLALNEITLETVSGGWGSNRGNSFSFTSNKNVAINNVDDNLILKSGINITNNETNY
jgi:hypothetical protein